MDNSTVTDKNPLWNKLNNAWNTFYKFKQRKDLENIKKSEIEILNYQHKLLKEKDPYIKNIAIFEELIIWVKIQP